MIEDPEEFDDLEIVDVPAWTPDDDLDEDDYAKRFAFEHASVLADIECDLDDEVYASARRPVVDRPRVRPRPSPRYRVPRAVRDIGSTA